MKNERYHISLFSIYIMLKKYLVRPFFFLERSRFLAFTTTVPYLEQSTKYLINSFFLVKGWGCTYLYPLKVEDPPPPYSVDCDYSYPGVSKNRMKSIQIMKLYHQFNIT